MDHRSTFAAVRLERTPPDHAARLFPGGLPHPKRWPPSTPDGVLAAFDTQRLLLAPLDGGDPDDWILTIVDGASRTRIATQTGSGQSLTWSTPGGPAFLDATVAIWTSAFGSYDWVQPTGTPSSAVWSRETEQFTPLPAVGIVVALGPTHLVVHNQDRGSITLVDRTRSTSVRSIEARWYPTRVHLVLDGLYVEGRSELHAFDLEGSPLWSCPRTPVTQALR